MLEKRRKKRVKSRRYTDLDKRQAVIEFTIVGTTLGTAKNLGMPRDTLRAWMKSDWWFELLQEARDDIDDRMEAEQAHIIRLAHKRVIQGLTEGDEKLVVDHKTKEHVIKHVLPSTQQAAVVGAIFTDKRRQKLNLPTSVTSTTGGMEALAEQFRQLARDHESYQEKRINSIKGESEEVK